MTLRDETQMGLWTVITLPLYLVQGPFHFPTLRSRCSARPRGPMKERHEPANHTHPCKMNLLDDLCERYADANNALNVQAEDLRRRLGAVDLSEAQSFYRLVSEQSELPRLGEALGYLEHPFVLFGDAFVAKTIEDLRAGSATPPSSSGIRYVPLDEDCPHNEF